MFPSPRETTARNTSSQFRKAEWSSATVSSTAGLHGGISKLSISISRLLTDHFRLEWTWVIFGPLNHSNFSRIERRLFPFPDYHNTSIGVKRATKDELVVI